MYYPDSKAAGIAEISIAKRHYIRLRSCEYFSVGRSTPEPVVSKAARDCCKLPLKPQKTEEIQAARVSLAAA